ncbi:hypothetical protein F5Y15DRAFT_399206 [Xylariaceae sp. FL0016]|nr:hypothetical protein F5Y15DRAFT_399206 [Xylariaceae sp. FL0016]
MVGLSFEQIAASRPFRILVGTQKREFTIHASLLASISPPLERLVNNNMKESKDGLAEWPEVDEASFVQFCEFAYTGSYQNLQPICNEAEAEAEAVEDEPGPDPPMDENIEGNVYQEETKDFHNNWNGMVSRKKKKCKKSLRLEKEEFWPPSPGSLWQRFESLSYTVSPAPTEPDPKIDLLRDWYFDNVFLSHARMYVLADYYDIDKLAKLSLQKLHSILALARSPSNSFSASDIIPVLEYCFTSTVNKGGVQDELRALLVRYVACRVEGLWEDDAFQDVLERFGELSRAVVGALRERLNE